MNNKPNGTRDDLVCTFNSEIVPIEEACDDRNGANNHKGCPKRFYHVVRDNDNNIVSCTIAKNQNGVFVIGERKGATYMKLEGPGGEVYLLTRKHSNNKPNPGFVQMFADESISFPYY